MQTARRIPTHYEVRQRLASLLNEIAKIPTERITDSATVDEELQMQSITFVELLVAVEDEYQIGIDPLTVVDLNDFGRIADYIYREIANSGTA
jgi:acyl carrier protein